MMAVDIVGQLPDATMESWLRRDEQLNAVITTKQ